MAMTIRMVLIGAAVSLAAPAWGQAASRSAPPRIVTKTLVASEAQKECLSLNSKQRLYYRFRADGPVSFKLSHQNEREVVDLKRDGTDSASGRSEERRVGKERRSRWE